MTTKLLEARPMSSPGLFCGSAARSLLLPCNVTRISTVRIISPARCPLKQVRLLQEVSSVILSHLHMRKVQRESERKNQRETTSTSSSRFDQSGVVENCAPPPPQHDAGKVTTRDRRPLTLYLMGSGPPPLEETERGDLPAWRVNLVSPPIPTSRLQAGGWFVAARRGLSPRQPL